MRHWLPASSYRKLPPSLQDELAEVDCGSHHLGLRGFCFRFILWLLEEEWFAAGLV